MAVTRVVPGLEPEVHFWRIHRTDGWLCSYVLRSTLVLAIGIRLIGRLLGCATHPGSRFRLVVVVGGSLPTLVDELG